MAKFYGVIGYAETVETRPGVWTNQIIERNYYGDVIRNTGKWSDSSYSVNDNLSINNQFSILADSYAITNSRLMKYLEFMGTKWKITSIEPRYPRLILTVGGEYNGPQT